MKKIITLLFIVFVSFVSAQTNVYYPLPDTNTVWSVSAFKYIVNGDSIYNAKVYKKYYVTTDTTATSSLQYVGMVRQDIANKKVYGIGAWSTTEGIIYDFSLNVNDTITVHPIDIMCMGYSTLLKVTAKDSALINGNYRQRFSVANYSNSFFIDTLIEGIGSCEGPLAPGLNPYCATDVCWPVLLCQKQNGVVVYQNPLYQSCYFNCGVGIAKLKNINNELNVYPNPAQNSMQVTLEGSSNIQAISLFDVLGNEVLSTKIKEIDISNLQNGIYFLQVKTNEAVVAKKIIIQR